MPSLASDKIRLWFRVTVLITLLMPVDKLESFMVALCNRADHKIFMLFLSSSSFLFFPRLISAVGDWMFTILWHMVWP